MLRAVLLPANADDDQTVELQAVRSRDGHGRLRLALEALQLGDPGDEAHRVAAEFLRDAFGHLAVVAGEHDRVAPFRTSERQKIDLDGVGHEALRQAPQNRGPRVTYSNLRAPPDQLCRESASVERF